MPVKATINIAARAAVNHFLFTRYTVLCL